MELFFLIEPQRVKIPTSFQIIRWTKEMKKKKRDNDNMQSTLYCSEENTLGGRLEKNFIKISILNGLPCA